MFLLKIEIEGEFFWNQNFCQRSWWWSDTHFINIHLNLEAANVFLHYPHQKNCEEVKLWLQNSPLLFAPSALWKKTFCYFLSVPVQGGYEPLILRSWVNFSTNCTAVASYHKNNGDFSFWQQKRHCDIFKEIFEYTKVSVWLPLCLSNDINLNAITSTDKAQILTVQVPSTGEGRWTHLGDPYGKKVRKPQLFWGSSKGTTFGFPFMS